MPLSPPGGEQITPIPEHMYDDFLFDNPSTAHKNSKGVLHLLGKLTTTISLTIPSTDQYNTKHYQKDAVSAIGSILNEIEAMVHGPRGIGNIIETSGVASGSIRNKFLVVNRILKMLKHDWFINNNLFAASDGAFKVTPKHIDKAIAYYLHRSRIFYKHNQAESKGKKESFDQTFKFPGNPVASILKSKEYAYLRDKVPQ